MRRVTSYSFLALALGLSLASLTGCNSFVVGNIPVEPSITGFAANPAVVTAGGSVSLTGVFSNGTGVITPGNLVATSGRAVSVSPTATTIYTLTVTNSAGVEASQATTVTVNSMAQTITFANPGLQTVGTPLALAATASSGLTISFASTTTGVCTVAGTTATFIAAGTCTIQATQPGNSTYAAAAPVSQSFTVNAALMAQAITFTNPGAQMVGMPRTLAATASSGLTVSFASTTAGVCSISGTTATFIAAGTCTIQATQLGNSTYAAAAQVSQSFTVNAALTAQTITFTNPGVQTVGTPLALAATASSGLTVSFASTTANVCTVAGTTATFIAAGTCTIQATQPGNSTYAAAAPVSQSFIINAAIPAAPTGLTATAGNASVALSWTASAGADSYNVYRGTTAGDESSTPIATGITTTFYTDSTVTNSTTYFYKVAAVNGAGTSPLSNEASAMPSTTALYSLPPDRITVWNPGLNSVGGVPSATWPICTATTTPLTPSGGDDTVQINNAINTCPVGSVVQLGTGTFLIDPGNRGNYVAITKGVVLHGE
jgi:hypothetical protein